MSVFKGLQSVFSQKQSSLQKTAYTQKKTPAYRAVEGFVAFSPTMKDSADRFMRRLNLEFARINPHIQCHVRPYMLNRSYEQAYGVLAKHNVLERSQYRKSDETFRFMVTLGHWETQVVSGVRSLADQPLAHYYCVSGVYHEPKSEAFCATGRVGIEALQASPREYVDGVMAVRPSTRQVCLLFDHKTPSTPFNEFVIARSREFRAEFARYGVITHEQHWNPGEFIGGLSMVVDDVDVVIALEGPAIHVHRKSLVAACRERGVMLCVTELDSVLFGAGLGSGLPVVAYVPPLVSDLTSVLLGAQKDRRILIPAQEGLRYNLKALECQGVMLTDEQRALLKMRSIYSCDDIEY